MRGARRITVLIDSGATCFLEGYNAGRKRRYSSGNLIFEEDLLTGKIKTVYGNFTATIYAVRIDELASGARRLTNDWNVCNYGIYGVSWLNATSLKFTGELWYGLSNRTDVVANPKQAFSYIIFSDGTYIYAKKGFTGQIDFRG